MPLIFQIFMKMCFSHSIINFHFREKHLPAQHFFITKFFFSFCQLFMDMNSRKIFKNMYFLVLKNLLVWWIIQFSFTGTIIVEFWNSKRKKFEVKNYKMYNQLNRTLICSVGSLKSNAYNEKSTVNELSSTSTQNDPKRRIQTEQEKQ